MLDPRPAPGVRGGATREPACCVILAAGQGSRLGRRAAPKPLVPVLGLALLERTVMTAVEASLTRFVVVTGWQAQRVESFIAELRLRRGLEITAIRNEAWEAGNASSLLAARELLTDTFVLLVADHVFEAGALRRLLAEDLGEGEIVVAADFRPARKTPAELQEATKLQLSGRWVSAIGKQLPRCDALDAGMFLCSPAALAAFEESVLEGDGSLADGVRRLAQRRRARAVDIGEHPWVDVDTARDLRSARALLCRGLGKPADGLISRHINRRLSAWLLTPALLRLAPGITANQVSALGFVVALGAAALFVAGRPVLAGAAVQLASVLDGCDGEVARLKKRQSRFGSFFDAVLDRYADTLLLAGAGYYSWSAGRQSALFWPDWRPVTALVAVFAIAGTLLQSYTSAKSVSELGYRYRRGPIAAGRGRDLRLLIVAVGGLAAGADVVAVPLALAALALLTNAVVAARVWTSWQLVAPAPPLTTAFAVIFDFDGTIADTMPFLTAIAVELLCANYGIGPTEARRRYLQTAGVDFRSQLEELFPGDPRNDALAASFEAAKRAGLSDCPVFAGVRELLAELERAGIRRFLCSSTTTELILAYLRDHGLTALFDDCLGFAPGLPKPEQVKLILTRHRLRPEEVVFVGDSPRDHELLSATGVRFLGIGGLCDGGEFRRRGLASVDGLAGLLRWWRRHQALASLTEPVLAGEER